MGDYILLVLFTESIPSLIQSINTMSVCLQDFVCLPLQNDHFQVSWRLLVKGQSANIGLR